MKKKYTKDDIRNCPQAMKRIERLDETSERKKVEFISESKKTTRTAILLGLITTAFILSDPLGEPRKLKAAAVLISLFLVLCDERKRFKNWYIAWLERGRDVQECAKAVEEDLDKQCNPTKWYDNLRKKHHPESFPAKSSKVGRAKKWFLRKFGRQR